MVWPQCRMTLLITLHHAASCEYKGNRRWLTTTMLQQPGKTGLSCNAASSVAVLQKAALHGAWPYGRGNAWCSHAHGTPALAHYARVTALSSIPPRPIHWDDGKQWQIHWDNGNDGHLSVLTAQLVHPWTSVKVVNIWQRTGSWFPRYCSKSEAKCLD